MTLKSSLEKLTDYDVAYHELACLLGMAEPKEFSKYKSIYNSNNDVNNAFHRIIRSLIEIEAIIYDEEECMIKWNDKFKLDGWNRKGYTV